MSSFSCPSSGRSAAREPHRVRAAPRATRPAARAPEHGAGCLASRSAAATEKTSSISRQPGVFLPLSVGDCFAASAAEGCVRAPELHTFLSCVQTVHAWLVRAGPCVECCTPADTACAEYEAACGVARCVFAVSTTSTIC